MRSEIDRYAGKLRRALARGASAAA
jgi:hypothetical protein